MRVAIDERRLEGASYEEIARSGGGIRSTVAATRAAGDDALFEAAAGRARTLMAEGVATLEIKSGYGLREADERRCLVVALDACRQRGRQLGFGANPGDRGAIDDECAALDESPSGLACQRGEAGVAPPDERASGAAWLVHGNASSGV